MYPFERFSTAAKRVLTLAQEEAERAHHSYIGTEHLLLGLIREADGAGALVLLRLGVSEAAARAAIEAVVGRQERILIQQIIPTSRVKKVIEIAFEEARRLKVDHVGTEHILLGLMIEGEGVASHVLTDLGVSLEAVRASLSEQGGIEEAAGPAVRAIPPGSRVLVHQVEPPHRLIEGRVVDGVTLRLTVELDGAAVEVEAAMVHPVPGPSTFGCPYCRPR